MQKSNRYVRNEKETKFLLIIGKAPLYRYQSPSSLGILKRALNGEVYPFCRCFGKVLSP